MKNMRGSCQIIFAVALICGCLDAVFGSAWQHKGPKEIVATAIVAHGGKLRLEMLRSSRIKLKGSLYSATSDQVERIPLAIDYWHQDAGKLKYIFTFEYKGNASRIIRVFDGQRGWVSLNGTTKQLPDIALVGIRESFYNTQVARLYPLLEEGKGYELSLVRDEKGQNRNVVKVALHGHDNVMLYLDKKSNLLTKVAHFVSDDEGKKAFIEEYFAEFKDIEGLKFPTKQVRTVNGKKDVELEVMHVELDAKIDPGLFSKP